MNTDVELLLREGLDRLTAAAQVDADMAGRVLTRRRRRRAAGYATAAAAAAAVTAAVVFAATGGTVGPAATRMGATGRPAATGPALATAYVVRRVEDALANDDQVMRETQSWVAPNGPGSLYFDGQQTYHTVTWGYRGRSNTESLGGRGQLQGAMGTGIVNGRLRVVQVDYIRHRWGLTAGYLSTGPVNACRTPVLLGGWGESTNWPSVIQRTLACGRYRIMGYARIDGTDTIKMRGTWVLPAVPSSPATTITDTLFVTPVSFLPVRITQSSAVPGLHGSLNSADIRWLPPTPANRARASVTIPCGYQQINWSSGKPARGQPSSGCG